jgi:hypothetical protein
MFKNIVYFASGEYKKEYEKLPAEKVYLVDYNFNVMFNIVESKKVIQIPMYALQAIDYFCDLEIKFDCFISINEGMGEGGGKYFINRDGFWGYAMKVMNKEFYHIWHPTCYGYPVFPLILPYKRKRADRNILGDFDYNTFSAFSGRYIKVQKLSEKSRKPLELNLSGIKICLKNESIWKDSDSLDGIFFSCNKNKNRSDFYEDSRKNLIKFYGSKEKVVLLEERKPLEEIFKICSERKIKKAGITPWLFGEYEDAINTLENYKGSYPKELTFYHLNPEDFSMIYNWAAQKQLI